MEQADLKHIQSSSSPINTSDYTKQNFCMYGGNLERVTIQFPDHMAGVVLYEGLGRYCKGIL